MAVKYVNNNPAQGVARTLCAYPKVAVYDGSGSTDDAANFSCRTPRHRSDHHDGGHAHKDHHDIDHDDDEDE